MLKWYTLCDIEDKEQYAKFIEYMLKSSDCFSVIYFRHNEGERLRKSAKQIRDELRPFKIYSKNTNEWPGTITWDKKHIYRTGSFIKELRADQTGKYATRSADWVAKHFGLVCRTVNTSLKTVDLLHGLVGTDVMEKG